MIKNFIKHSPVSVVLIFAVVLGAIGCTILLLTVRAQAVDQGDITKKLITIHDRGQEKVILTQASSVEDTLKDANIILDKNDTVEPALSTELIDRSYYINIYRARPVIVTDGVVREKIMTPYQTADKIAADAGLDLNDQDKTTLQPAQDIVSEGAGLELTIDRATQFTLVFYGKKTTAYTQATTVTDMLKEKAITLGANDHLSVDDKTAMTAGMTVELWRDGKQTVTEDQEIPFPTEKVYDAARPVGYHEVQAPGALGKRTVTYEIEMKNGQEVGRKEIQKVTTQEPKKQVEIVGIKPRDGLSKAKGVYMFTDSNGISHRETYYDLLMNVVMRNCGGDGTYTVREDGVKVDKDGYVLIAAHLGRYPRCSVVETSLGPGKVYDTGSFTSKHPDGFDLATDWTNSDGR